jgi:hypothetical protein
MSAFGTSRHFAALRNLVAIGAQRTSSKPHQSSSIYEDHSSAPDLIPRLSEGVFGIVSLGSPPTALRIPDRHEIAFQRRGDTRTDRPDAEPDATATVRPDRGFDIHALEPTAEHVADSTAHSPAVEIARGLVPPSRLLPTWTMILLNSGRPEFRRTIPE